MGGVRIQSHRLRQKDGALEEIEKWKDSDFNSLYEEQNTNKRNLKARKGSVRHCPAAPSGLGTDTFISQTSETAQTKTKALFLGAWLLVPPCLLCLFDPMHHCGYVLLGLLGSALLIYPASGVNDKVVLKHQEAHLNLLESKSSLSRTENGSTTKGIPIITFKWDHVEAPFLVVLWILVAGLAKLGT